jgi:hypothetical protein
MPFLLASQTVGDVEDLRGDCGETIGIAGENTSVSSAGLEGVLTLLDVRLVRIEWRWVRFFVLGSNLSVSLSQGLGRQFCNRLIPTD